ncbi:MAG: SIS domain-containing protein [Tepidisphaera sp.]|nr:SIS domain-containing protein [Tepidisphaera sp.]
MPVTSHEVFLEASQVLAQFAALGDQIARIDEATRRMAAGFRIGGKVLACGNGGSACEAMHLCEELTGRFRHDRPALPAIACVDSGHLTCVGNDYGYERVFARWVEALGVKGDTLVVFSTSGNSKNVIEAVGAAKQRGLYTLALLGGSGGQLAGRCDVEWIVPSKKAERVQEVHQVIMHALIAGIERELFPEQAG